MNTVTKYDKNFDESLFLTKIDHIFIMILSAIMDNDMNSVKHYLSNDIYLKFNNIVKEYKEKGYTRIFDEMNVKSTRIENAYFSDNCINIDTIITSRYMDYLIDENGDYISGINTHRIEKEHKITFSKLINSKDLGEVTRCPSCGNTLDINKTGVCPYCHNIIDMSNYDYIITKIDLF